MHLYEEVEEADLEAALPMDFKTNSCSYEVRTIN
jgi:hypothetical protein